MNVIDTLLAMITSQENWVLHVFFIVVAVLLLDFAQRKALNKLIHHAENKTANIWDDAVLHSAKRPISLVLWLIGMILINELVYRTHDGYIAEAIDGATHVGIIISITWFFTSFIRFAQQKLIDEQKAKSSDDEGRLDIITIEALGKLFRLAIMITAGIVILETLGFSISGVLAFGGIGGIAVGFAAKDLLSNFFGGLMIYLDRPFAVGDWVRSDDRKIEGTVENIGWRQTRIRTFSKRPIYVPNAVFTSIVVENPSRMSHRRIYETLGVRYDDVAKMQTIVNDVKQMLLEHPQIDTNQTLIVNFNAFSASSVDFFVYTFTKTTNWIVYHEVKQDVLLKVAEIVERNGAEFAFPTSTLHIQNQSPELAGLVADEELGEVKK